VSTLPANASPLQLTASGPTQEPLRPSQNMCRTCSPAIIDLASVRDLDELIEMGTPRLKATLKARGMRTGGSAALLAERLWWKCKLSLFADESRNRIAREKSLRPVGAYSAVQPTNLSKQKQMFLEQAREFEAGQRHSPPDNPMFEYADSHGCEPSCPSVPCTCSRYKLWQVLCLLSSLVQKYKY
jgi:hypothetical protein